MMARSLPRFRSRLVHDTSGIAITEFALSLPMFLFLALGGAEIASFVVTKMRVSQVALHIADHTARIGTGTALAIRTISETQINDALIGAGLQAGQLRLFENGRVIVSSLQPVANPNPTNRYTIGWQRCLGVQNRASSYGAQGDTNLIGMGPAGREVRAPEGGSTVFVEVHYQYRPLIFRQFAPDLRVVEIGAMPVRERRQLTPQNPEGAQPATCNRFTATT